MPIWPIAAAFAVILFIICVLFIIFFPNLKSYITLDKAFDEKFSVDDYKKKLNKSAAAFANHEDFMKSYTLAKVTPPNSTFEILNIPVDVAQGEDEGESNTKSCALIEVLLCKIPTKTTAEFETDPLWGVAHKVISAVKVKDYADDSLYITVGSKKKEVIPAINIINGYVFDTSTGFKIENTSAHDALFFMCTILKPKFNTPLMHDAINNWH